MGEQEDKEQCDHCGKFLCDYGQAYCGDACAASEHENAVSNGDHCPVDDCSPCIKDRVRGALDAGIPLSVIMGETKLTDHFSESTIARMCGRTDEADEIDRAEMIDAGRGHLVRR